MHGYSFEPWTWLYIQTLDMVIHSNPGHGYSFEPWTWLFIWTLDRVIHLNTGGYLFNLILI